MKNFLIIYCIILVAKLSPHYGRELLFRFFHKFQTSDFSEKSSKSRGGYADYAIRHCIMLFGKPKVVSVSYHKIRNAQYFLVNNGFTGMKEIHFDEVRI